MAENCTGVGDMHRDSTLAPARLLAAAVSTANTPLQGATVELGRSMFGVSASLRIRRLLRSVVVRSSYGGR